GTYAQDEERVPRIRALTLSFDDPAEDWEQVLRENYSTRESVTEALANRTPTPIFVVEPARDPALYIGFDAQLPNELQRLYVMLVGNRGVEVRPAPRRQPEDVPPVGLTWEYSRGRG